MKKRTLAILSPSQNAYSETFIRAHKNLDFNVKFYYGGRLPGALEGRNSLLNFSLVERVKIRLLRGLSFAEKRLLFSLRKEKVDCILAEYGNTACESFRVIQYTGLPLVVHFHGFDSCEKNDINFYKTKYGDVFRYASAVVVVSKKMYNDVLNLGCPKDKMILNYYGPNDDYFKITPAYNSRQFVAVGRFVKKKAPHLTILAFSKVVKKFQDATLVMIGGGELLSVCKELVNGLNIRRNVIFKEILQKEKIAEIFQESIAFVQHSVIAESGDSEGTPVAVLEAQAAGLPVIATLHAGIPDVVINDKTGLLVEEHDVDAMAASMIRILEEEGVAQRLGISGRERIREKFTMQQHITTLNQLIKNTIVE
jgi:glycosyltransferase involved in cell wall biosynthesis